MRFVMTTEVQLYYFFYYSGGQVHPVAVEIGYQPPHRAFAIELRKLQPICSLVFCLFVYPIFTALCRRLSTVTLLSL